MSKAGLLFRSGTRSSWRLLPTMPPSSPPSFPLSAKCWLRNHRAVEPAAAGRPRASAYLLRAGRWRIFRSGLPPRPQPRAAERPSVLRRTCSAGRVERCRSGFAPTVVSGRLAVRSGQSCPLAPPALGRPPAPPAPPPSVRPHSAAGRPSAPRPRPPCSAAPPAGRSSCAGRRKRRPALAGGRGRGRRSGQAGGEHARREVQGRRRTRRCRPT